MQQFDRFCGQSIDEEAHTGDVAARAAQTRYNAQFHRVAAHRKHDWNCRGHYRLCLDYRDCSPGGYKYVNRATCQTGGEFWQSIEMAFCEAGFNEDILLFDKAGFRQTSLKRCDNIYGVSSRPGTEVADHWQRLLLRKGRKRPTDSAAHQCDEVAPPHRLPVMSCLPLILAHLQQPRANQCRAQADNAIV